MDKIKKENKRRSLIVAIFAVYILAVSISSAYAARIINYTYDAPDTIEDEFTPVAVSGSIKDNGNGTYTLKNESDTSVYLRFSPVPNWVSTTDGKIYWKAPTCTVTGLDSSKWMTGADGYYYYITPLEAGASVTVTITNTTALTPPVNHEFRVNLVMEVIQSEPIAAMQEAWDINIVPDNQNGNQSGSGLEEETTLDDPQQGLGGAQ